MSDGERKKNYKLWTLIFLLLILSFVYPFFLFRLYKKETFDIRQTQDEQYTRHIETNQFLLSTIDWSSRRTNLILFMRDQIELEWKRVKFPVNLDEAYLIAETIVRECENYSYIDPFFVLATQNIESSFNKLAKSKAGAKGINQFMPSTGRILAGHFGQEYSDSLLYNIKVSTKFAFKLIDILYTQYKEWDLVLADYNGGPYQAYYYKYDKSSLSKETSKYVPDVLNKKVIYDSLFIKYRINEKMNISKLFKSNVVEMAVSTK